MNVYFFYLVCGGVLRSRFVLLHLFTGIVQAMVASDSYCGVSLSSAHRTILHEVKCDFGGGVL